MGGGAKSTSTSTSGSAQKWAIPLAQQGAHDVQGVFNANQPGIQRLTQTVQGNIVPELVNRFQAGGATVDASRGHLNDILSGTFLRRGNPYLQNVIASTNRDVRNGVNSNFEGMGRYGSGAHDQVVTRELANADANLRYTDYANQSQRMDQAAQMGLQSGLSDVAQALAAAGVGAEIPYAGSSNLANSLGALFNGGTSKSVEKGQSPIWGAIGAGLSAAGAAASDRRLKRNITLVRRDADGLGWYDWEWKSTGEKAHGVIADEVKQLRPWAYIKGFVNGVYDGVNYATL